MTPLFAKQHIRHLAVILLAVCAAFGISLTGGFAMDDDDLVELNPAVHGLSGENIVSVFTPSSNAFSYQPIRDLTYMADYTIFGLRPWGYHLSNLFYYCLACMMFYVFASRLFIGLRLGTQAPMAALWTAMIFSIHPVQGEVAAVISQRKDILCALFIFASLYAYLRYLEERDYYAYALSLITAVFAMLSKTTAVGLPVILFMFHFMGLAFGRRLATFRYIARIAPFFLLALGVGLLNLSILRQIGYEEAFVGGTAAGLFYTSATATARYALMLVVPWPLGYFHPHPLAARLLDPWVLVSLSGMAAVLVLAAWQWRRRPLIGFSVLWFLMFLAPTFTTTYARMIMWERFLILPLAGISLLAGWQMARLGDIPVKPIRNAIFGLTVVVLVIWTGLSIRQSMVWRSDFDIISSAEAVYPDSLEIQCTLGLMYFKKGEYDEAFAHFRRANQISPIALDYLFYKAYYQFKQGDSAGAIEGLKKLQAIYPEDIIDIHYLNGVIYESIGQVDLAVQSYNRAIGAKMQLCSAEFTIRDVRRALQRLAPGN